MHGPLLAIACNAFIPLCVSVNLNNKNEIKTKWGENFANSYSNVIQFYIFAWFPIIMLFVMFSSERKRNGEDFKTKYKFLVRGIKTRTVA